MGNTASNPSSHEPQGSQSVLGQSLRAPASPNAFQKPVPRISGPGGERATGQAPTMLRQKSSWQPGDSDKPWAENPDSEPNLAQKTGGGGRDFDSRHRIVESRVVPDDENLHAQPPPPQQPAPAAIGGYRTGGALVRGSRFGSAFDIDVERGPGTPMPGEGGAVEKSRKGSWVDTVTGMMDGLYLAAESVVKDTVRDWEAPPPPPPLSKMADPTHFGSHGHMVDYGVTASNTDYEDAGTGYKPTGNARAMDKFYYLSEDS
ncbi:hypothetical protein HDU88_004995 [Geranomyces variabilis]|nr:hypothetical protein HDU88_004995 [Geranomyces variabilis]